MRAATPAEMDRDDLREGQLRWARVQRAWDAIEAKGGGAYALAEIERLCRKLDVLGEAANNSGTVAPREYALMTSILCAARAFLGQCAEVRADRRRYQQELDARNKGVIAQNFEDDLRESEAIAK